MTTDYQMLNTQLAALIHGVPHRTANLANAAALLYHTLEGLNWAGFYLLEGDILVLGPFQGKPACMEIPMGRGGAGRQWWKIERSSFTMFTSSPATSPVTAHQIQRLWYPSMGAGRL